MLSVCGLPEENTLAIRVRMRPPEEQNPGVGDDITPF